ncbi:MAG: glutamate dehydrogenase [bacterium]|jgi:glutamate dehydrogenase
MTQKKTSTNIVAHREELVRDQLYKLRNIINEHVEESKHHVFEQFTEILLEQFSIKFLLNTSVEELFTVISSRFNYLSQNYASPIQVAVQRLNDEDGDYLKGSVKIEFTVNDRPFIVDSVREYLRKKKYAIRQMVHPILTLSTHTGEINSIQKSRQEDLESVAYLCMCLDQVRDQDIEELKEDLTDLLGTIEAVTDDYGTVKEVLSFLSKKPEGQDSELLRDSEFRQLFKWFDSGNMVFLGAGQIALENAHKFLTWDHIIEPLGLIRFRKENGIDSFPKDIGTVVDHYIKTDLQVNLVELNEYSIIHRKRKIILILYRHEAQDGSARVFFFPTIFTNKSKNEGALSIPLARLKVNGVLEGLSNIETSYSYKRAHEFFNTLPKHELFRITREEMSILLTQTRFEWERNEARFFAYTQPERQYARLTISIPNRQFQEKILHDIEQKLNTTLSATPEIKYWFPFGKNIFIHYIYWFPEDHPQLSNLDLNTFEKELIQLTSNWKDELSYEIQQLSSEQVTQYQPFTNIFSKFYQAVHTPEQAKADIIHIHQLLEEKKLQVDLKRNSATQSKLSIYNIQQYSLTDVMPIIHNLALTVMEETTFDLEHENQKIWLSTFQVTHQEVSDENFESYKQNLRDLLQAIFTNQCENAVINGLLTTALLNKEEINLFLLYINYYQQIGTVYTRKTVTNALLTNPNIIQALRNYFFQKFQDSESLNYENEDHLVEVREEVIQAISEVKTVTEDLIFKNIFNYMTATIRTNFFHQNETVGMAIKVKSTLVEHMPLPRPYCEIYVHSAAMEGIHLRGGMIARGGIRHSDRKDDFRTEVLGLVKAQMMKNSIIVPVGSKGGFITKKVTNSRKELFEEGEKQYKVYINSLLSLTDNFKEGKVIPAEGLVRYDHDDPYLVVAADKGTAHLSDTANTISTGREFWLGDAFASGGSAGYNHKVIGITAGGAWECVKLHFLEMGKDIQNEDFSVIGIGDMNGDVFGNGMLLSRHIRLQGAFNHIHIFVDPSPETESTWEERKRLFDLPTSSWMDYNQDLISQGGGIFERHAKEIQLSPEIKELVGTEEEKVSGEELIRLLLKAKADLLWNGGIGTYVKASNETALEVGDQANDNVRIDAKELRSAVFGEGGNLGITQQGRIEFAMKGGKINADSIDNSGGVDISDHEVNLKIMLNNLIENNAIQSGEERNQVLYDLTDDVTNLCLADNVSQGKILSMDHQRSQEDLLVFLNHIQFLAVSKLLDRRTEKIPNNNQLNQYFNMGMGVPRPVLSTLLSYTKMYLFQEVMESDLVNQPYLYQYFLDYFPQALRDRFDLKQFHHRLEKEIIGTVLVNKVINNTGVTLLPHLFAFTQASAVQILQVYTIVNQIIGADELRQNIYDSLPATQLKDAYPLLLRVEKVLRNLIGWLLNNQPREEISFEWIERFTQPFQEYQALLTETLSVEDQEVFDHDLQEIVDVGVSQEIATQILHLERMQGSFEVITLAQNTNTTLLESIQLIQLIDEKFFFSEMTEKMMNLKLDSSWERKHRGILSRKLNTHKRNLATMTLNEREHEQALAEALQKFIYSRRPQMKHFEKEFHSFSNAGADTISGFAVMSEYLSELF